MKYEVDYNSDTGYFFSKVDNRFLIEFRNTRDVSMVGPSVGELWINSEFVGKDLVVTDIVLSDDKSKLLFATFHRDRKVWSKFNIIVLQLLERRAFQSIEYYSGPSFDSIDGNTILYYDSVEPASDDECLTTEFNDTTFHPIDLDFSFFSLPAV